MPDDPGAARNLRVSDAEREHVIGLLQRATGAGLLDLDEFTQRVDTVLAARTRGELNVVLLDLPGMTHPERPAQVPVQHPPSHPAAPSGAVNTTRDTRGGTELRSVLSTVTRRGDWDVPARLVVRTALGTTELDFTEARIPHDVVEIELDVVAGTVELRLPEGSRVERDAVQATLSSIDDHTRGRSGTGSGPTFRLSGAVRAGSVEIRPPRRARWWRRD